MPDGWIDRLFQRFSVLYGKHWNEMWADVPLADVKDAWETELAGVSGFQLQTALRQVGKFPPTLPEFVALCKPPAVPAAHRPFLPAPKRVRGEIDPKVMAAIDRHLKRGQKRDPKGWAREIMAMHERGEYLLPIQVEFAREALGMKS